MRTEYRSFTNDWKRISLALLLVSSVLLIGAPRAGKSAGLAAAQSRRGVVIFAVSAESGGGTMDAVVIVDGKQLRAPVGDEDKAGQKKFAAEYFAGGRAYRLISGGGDAGSVAVKKWSEGCNNVHAEVTPSTSVRLGGQVKALATTSDSLGKRASSRRAPTDEERTGVMTLVKSIYTQNRTPAGLIPSIKVTNLTATDLDGDGKYELVGSFTLAAKNKFERDLFLIAHQQELFGYFPIAQPVGNQLEYLQLAPSDAQIA